MSEKKRKRGRPRMVPSLSYGAELKLRNKEARVIKKPKYLRDPKEQDEDDITGALHSVSGQDLYADKEAGSNSNQSKNSRGYNPQACDKLKDSEYHYGSDFECDDELSDTLHSNHSISSSDVSSSTDMDCSDDDSTSISQSKTDDNHSHGTSSMWWKLGPAGNLGMRAHTPIPVWLQDRIYPSLDLPKSSDDLLVPTPSIMKVIGIYEVLRHFRALLRLSPFLFEDFCGMLVSDEQSNLLTEIHLCLLKSLIREEDLQQTHFGAIDQRDSINIILYCIDSLTWSEALRLYLQSHPEFKSCLTTLESCNYPYVSITKRLEVLQFLCDQFLQTSVVREDLTSEGKIKYDDHCRFCHKTGDLLCCDSCNAVYHLDCVDPPLLYNPAELDDWTCAVCEQQEVKGVSDCLSPMESSGFLCRQEPLGYDRHGRKYWFLIRRIFVESEDGEFWYYSTVDHFELILSLIDKDDLEEGLFIALREFGDDIRRQMAITEELTNKNKGSKPSWLSIEKENLKDESEVLLKLKLKKDAETFDNMIEKVKDENVIKSNVVKEEEKDSANSLEDHIKNEIKEEVGEHPLDNEETDQKKELIDSPKEDLKQVGLLKLIDEKRKQLFSNLCNAFRLGCDNSHRSYSNVYVTNTLALNKLQHNEERDKRRHLSHKFSVSSNTDFKWSGHTTGSLENLISTLRATLLSIEGNVSPFFYHPNWTHVRKTWSQFVFHATDPADFAKAMRVLVSFIKPVVFTNAWNDSLGHIKFKRVTALEREERKKQEKKEKKDDEDKLFFFIKYTKGVKHQLWKVKGEEYRLHGLWGWIWNSTTRRIDKTSMFDVGLRSGPDKVTLPIKTPQTGVIRGLAIGPASYKQLIAKNSFLAPSILSPNQLKSENTDSDDFDPEKGHDILVANAGVQQRVNVLPLKLEDYLEDGLVNVSKNLNARTRLVYPKVAKPSTLDQLLTRRISLKLQEERELATKKSENPEDDKMIDVENGDSDFNLSDGLDDANIEELPDSQRPAPVHTQRISGNLLKEIKTLKHKYEELDTKDAFLPCYSAACRANGKGSCYSPYCLLKEKLKHKLVSCVSNYKIVTSNPSPYEQIGSSSPIRFNEDDSKEAGSKMNNGTRSRESTPKIDSSSEVKSLSDVSNENSQSSLVFERKNSEKEGRIYSTEKPCGKIYLKKYNVESKKSRKNTSKAPLISTFRCGKKGKARYSLFILPHWELKILSRKGGKYNPLYFNANAKPNQNVWSYPCSRPLFKTTWLFRTSVLPNISAAALQLKILWACLRWDDMQEKAPSDGRKQITTDLEIIQTEILKRKYSGRFMEKTDYLQRKIIIPFDVPKPVREFTPSQRSGLRKRRRAQSPVSKQPQSVEEWVEEEKVSLWEIKYFGERFEKAAAVNKKAVINDKSNSETNNASLSRSSSPAEFKAKIEEQLKIQRANFNQKKAFEVQTLGSNKGIVKLALGNALTGSKVTLGGSPINFKGAVSSPSTPGNAMPSLLSGRKIVTTKGGKIITVQAASPKSDAQPTKIALGNSSVFPVSSLPKVQVTPQGNKVIRFQTLSSPRQRSILPRVINPGSATSNALNPTVTAPTSTPAIRPTGQQIHIIRLPDGQVQVRGLQDGQQVIQRADGKFQFVNKSATTPLPTSTPSLIQLTKSPQKENNIPNVSTLSGGQIVKINGQQVLLRPASQNNKQTISISASEALGATGVTPSLKTTTAIPIKAVKTQDAILLKSPMSISNSQSSILKTQAADSKVGTSVPATNATLSSSVPAMSNCLTLKVQVRMTEHGPKTIIQGLEPGVGLTRDHIQAIQQQVKSMLNQYKLQVNQLSPLMTLTLQVANKNSTSQSSPVKSSQTQATAAPTIQHRTPTLAEPISFDDTKKINSATPPPLLKTVPENIFDQDSTTPDKTSPKKFVVTNEYIQQNVEDRLVQFQKYTSDKVKDPPTTQSQMLQEFPLSKSEKRPREQEDEWDTTLKGKTKRAKSEKAPKGGKKEFNNNTGTQSAKTLNQEAKKKAIRQQKLESMLTKHKDLLKKDILKKRALLEKELQLQIHKELSIAKQHMQTNERGKLGDSASKKKSGGDSASGGASVSSSTLDSSNRLFTQKKNDCLSGASGSPAIINTSKSGNKNSASKNKKNKGKSKKIVCICRTPFDDTRFYVGCDLCGNWFHGDCVGITETLSRTMTEYVCDDCANAKLNKELFCFCRQPYDEAQFYIFCEKCEGWYHGKCIGIMQQEAEDIDDYICPQCDPNTLWNLPCQKKLSQKDYIEMKKISKSLIQHKNAWPFLEPVDQSEVPDYYKVVKEPMDLKTIESKVTQHSYVTVAQFCGDVMLVFDNCRAYNPPNSSFWSCANTLENFFCSKLKQLKLKLGQKS